MIEFIFESLLVEPEQQQNNNIVNIKQTFIFGNLMLYKKLG